MEISSRTPEGTPSRCPLCGAETSIEFSDPAGDAPCPNCGCLMWEATVCCDRVVRRLEETLGIEPGQVTAETPLDGLGVTDSLDAVEVVMALEEEFDVAIPDDRAGRINTIGEAVRVILEQRDAGEPS